MFWEKTDISRKSALDITLFLIDKLDPSLFDSPCLKPIGGRKTFIDCLTYEPFINKFALWYDKNLSFGITSSVITCDLVFPFDIIYRSNFNTCLPLFHIVCKKG